MSECFYDNTDETDEHNLLEEALNSESKNNPTQNKLKEMAREEEEVNYW